MWLVSSVSSASGRVLVFSDHITDGVAHLLRVAGLNDLDLGGNAWIDDDTLLIDVRGRKSARATKLPPVGLTKAGLFVALSLLSDPTLAATSVREFSARSGASVSSVQATLKWLRAGRFLDDTGLRRGAALLDVWTSAYLTHGGLHRGAETLFADRPITPVEGEYQLSGEAAARRLGWGIRGPSAVIYTRDPLQARKTWRLMSRKTEHPVEVQRASLPASDNQDGLAASALIRADLMLLGDPRNTEIALEVASVDPNLRRLEAFD